MLFTTCMVILASSGGMLFFRMLNTAPGYIFSPVTGVTVNLDSILAGSERPFHRKRIAPLLFCGLADLWELDATLHFPYLFKNCWFNNRLMGTLHQIHSKLSTVLFLFASQKIWRIHTNPKYPI